MVSTPKPDSSRPTQAVPFGSGFYQRVPLEQIGRGLNDIDALVREKLNAREHLWVAITSYRMGDDALRNAAGSDDHMLILDKENLLDLVIGCYICELAFRKGLIGTMCLGMK